MHSAPRAPSGSPVSPPILGPASASASPEWIGIAGPTASGKSGASMAVARAFAARGRAVEIVSVDSALVYRGMDIGTAKPSPAELEEVPHHLVDLLDPAESYSAARFCADATAAIAAIRSRGALPLLVGGTMLYFKALLDGLDAMPAADPSVRAALDAEAAACGWPALHARLAAVDPATAARLAPNDAQRIQRALEVWQVAGRPLSSFHRAERPAADLGRTPLVSLEPDDRGWLHERIAQRFDAMLRDGLVAEVERLRARGDLHPDLPSMRCVGYRQAWEALDAGDLARLRERGIAATRQLAKRQITWLRGMPGRYTIACDAAHALDRTVELVYSLVTQSPQLAG